MPKLGYKMQISQVKEKVQTTSAYLTVKVASYCFLLTQFEKLLSSDPITFIFLQKLRL